MKEVNKNMFRKNIKNRIKRSAVTFVALGMISSLAACGHVAGEPYGTNENNSGANENNSGAADFSDKVRVVTTIFPEYDWVREVVGTGTNSVDKSAADSVDVSMLLDNGVDLHSYQPSAADIVNISTCDLFIYVGGESDKWVDDALKEATNKDMVVIDLMDVLGDSVKEEELVEGMQGEDEEEHSHEDEDADHDHEDADHDHEDADHENEDTDHEHEDSDDGHHHEAGEKEYDEHVWLSVKNAEILTNEIADKLSEIDPSHADAYKANAQAYTEKLSGLDKEYQSAVDNAGKDTLIFGDRFPFRYMVDDYGIKYYAAFVGCSAETEASFETIIFLAEKIDELNVPVICTIENSDAKIANTVLQNVKSGEKEIVTFNSLQSVTSIDVKAGANYLSIMQDNLNVLKTAIESK